MPDVYILTDADDGDSIEVALTKDLAQRRLLEHRVGQVATDPWFNYNTRSRGFTQQQLDWIEHVRATWRDWKHVYRSADSWSEGVTGRLLSEETRPEDLEKRLAAIIAKCPDTTLLLSRQVSPEELVEFIRQHVRAISVSDMMQINALWRAAQEGQ